MTQNTDHTELHEALRAAARGLALRQLLRCVVMGVAGAAVALTLGLLFTDLLPRLLFAAGLGVVPQLLFAAIGFIGGFGLEFRRRGLPDVHETAMALQARLPRDSGALTASLRATEADVFYLPLLRRARRELADALNEPAPVLIQTSRLVVTPLLVLAGCVSLALALTMKDPEPAPDTTMHGQHSAAAGDDWAGIDVATGRSDADAAALREALGMQEVATKLRNSAAVLRDAQASEAEQSSALAAARDAMADVGLRQHDQPVEVPVEVPDELPGDAADVAELAARLDSAAERLSAAAARIEAEGRKATQDRGDAGEFEAAATTREFVAFSVTLEPVAAPSALAAQSAARRGMAERAVSALESTRNP